MVTGVIRFVLRIVCLLGIEQITLLDGSSFFAKVKAGRDVDTAEEGGGKESGDEFIRNSWRSADGPVKTSNIRPSNAFFPSTFAVSTNALSLPRRSSWRLFPEKMITSFPTTLRRATYEFHELPPSLPPSCTWHNRVTSLVLVFPRSRRSCFFFGDVVVSVQRQNVLRDHWYGRAMPFRSRCVPRHVDERKCRNSRKRRRATLLIF